MKYKCFFKGNLLFGSVKALIVLLIFSAGSKADCQNSDKSESIFQGGSYNKTFSTSRIGVSQSVMTTPRGEFHVVIQHRFGELESGAYEFFGLDAALTRFGFDYGITDWLSAGIGRTLFEKTYDLELKAVFLKQNDSNVPVSLSYYIAAMENTLKGEFPSGNNSFGSRLSFANELFIARNQGIFSLQVAPLWLHSDYEVRTGSNLNIFAADLDGRIRISDMIGFIAEYIIVPKNEPFITTNPLTLGFDINTGGHQFQLIFSNTQGLNEKQFLTNTVGSWSKGPIYFGFNLTRVFNKKMD